LIFGIWGVSFLFSALAFVPSHSCVACERCGQELYSSGLFIQRLRVCTTLPLLTD
jgi:hypothetical protein